MNWKISNIQLIRNLTYVYNLIVKILKYIIILIFIIKIVILNYNQVEAGKIFLSLFFFFFFLISQAKD